MEFSTKVGRPETLRFDALVVGVHADGELTATAKALDAAAGGAIKAAVRSGDMSGKRGSTLLLRGLAGIASPRVLLVGSALASGAAAMVLLALVAVYTNMRADVIANGERWLPDEGPAG